jgi:hypothetical protein
MIRKRRVVREASHYFFFFAAFFVFVLGFFTFVSLLSSSRVFARAIHLPS